MKRSTAIGALIGAFLGAVVVLATATGPMVFVVLSIPGMLPFLLLEGRAHTPSFGVLALNSLVYSCAGALAVWLWHKLRALTAWLRSKRHPELGHCSNCGYDLTGNVSGVCPECGCATESLGKEDCDMGP
jgi:hypothetical protein